MGFAVGQQWVSAAIMFATGALFAGVSIASIVGDRSMAGIAWSGLFVLVGVGVIAQAAAAAREALRRRREFALACDGLLLVGRDLDEPLPTRGTTFELQNTDGRDLFVVLRHQGPGAATRSEPLACNGRDHAARGTRGALPEAGGGRRRKRLDPDGGSAGRRQPGCMSKLLVAYASKHGSTAEIAEAIGDELRAAGVEADVAQASEVGDVARYAGVVLGSAVYMKRWRPEARHFLRLLERELGDRPLWIFNSGPVGEEEADASWSEPAKVLVIRKR